MGKEMLIEKSIIINRSQNEVFNYLKFSKNQNEFSVWNMKDPNQKVSEAVKMERLVLYIYGTARIKMLA